ncbi:Rib/alpha-like domain-containing protein, partial [Streptococcus uberis]
MRRKKFNKHFDEISRKSRVKLHKSGKHWVRTVMSKIGLIFFAKDSASAVNKVTVSSEQLENLSHSHVTAAKLLRAVASAGAIAGAGMMGDQVLANETAVAEVTETTLLDDTVEMSAGQEMIEEVAELEQVSLSVSASESISESVSVSESLSLSHSESLSLSISESFSESVSESVSESYSESVSQSESTSESLSEFSQESETSASSSVTESDQGQERAVNATDIVAESAIDSSSDSVQEEKEVAVRELQNAIVHLEQAVVTADAMGIDINAAVSLVETAQTLKEAAGVTVEEVAAMTKRLEEQRQEVQLAIENDENDSEKVPEYTNGIIYRVNYVDAETGELVHRAPHSVIVTTTDPVATAMVTEVAQLPSGYSLAPGQSLSVTQLVTKGETNVLTVQVVKTGISTRMAEGVMLRNATAANPGEIVAERVRTETAYTYYAGAKGNLISVTPYIDPVAKTARIVVTIEHTAEQVASATRTNATFTQTGLNPDTISVTINGQEAPKYVSGNQTYYSNNTVERLTVIEIKGTLSRTADTTRATLSVANFLESLGLTGSPEVVRSTDGNTAGYTGYAGFNGISIITGKEATVPDTTIEVFRGEAYPNTVLSVTGNNQVARLTAETHPAGGTFSSSGGTLNLTGTAALDANRSNPNDRTVSSHIIKALNSSNNQLGSGRVIVVYKAQTEAYEATGKTVEASVGEVLSPEALVDVTKIASSLPDVPNNAKYTWESPVDTSSVGTKTGQVRVTYEDGSYDIVSVTVVVKESLSESVSESISESVSESVLESISESVSESVSESIFKSVSESVSESFSESV